MQINKVMKSLIIALPVVTMMACSSGPSDEELAAERNRMAQEQAEADRMEREQREAQVKAEAAARMERQQEVVKQQRDMLEREQTVYFDFDRAVIKPEFSALLDKHAEFLVANSSQSVVIEGHTDSRGTPEYNIALGERRAQAVETYLRNAGVSSSQIEVVSYGEEKPAVRGATDYAMAQNRRGVVVYK